MNRIQICNSALKLSPLALGNGPFGNGLDVQITHRLYAMYREAGGNVFDTAHCYSFWIPNLNGASERTLGKCIAKFNDREQVFIITKGGHPAVPPTYPRPDAFLSPEILAADINQSLERLGVERIDLYFVHRDDPRMPVKTIIDTLNTHIKAGRLGSIGASNWTTARIEQANAYAQLSRLQGFVASQPQYSLAHTNTPEPKTDPANRYLYDHDIDWHTRAQLPVICYSPTAGGYFATDGVRGKATFGNPTSLARLDRAKQLAEQMNLTPNQIALAYLMAQPFPVIPILGTSDEKHLADSLGSVKVQLTPQQAQWLKEGKAA
jgi:aryl-alcohol dehydrogenase-like predicted oxidoreductase